MSDGTLKEATLSDRLAEASLASESWRQDSTNPEPVVARRSAEASAPSSALLRLANDNDQAGGLVLVGMMALAVVLVTAVGIWGADYFSQPVAGRAGHPMHGVFGPTGTVGGAFGVAVPIVLSMGAGLLLARRRLSALHGLGHISDWIRFQIGGVGFAFVLLVLNAGFAVNSWTGVVMGALGVTCLSGLVGSFVGFWRPVDRDGQAVTRQTLEARRSELVQALWIMTDVPPERVEALLARASIRQNPGYLAALQTAIHYRFNTRKRRKRLAAALAIAETPHPQLHHALELLAEQHLIQAQLALMDPLGVIHRIWLRVHLPLVVFSVLVAAAYAAVLVNAS